MRIYTRLFSPDEPTGGGEAPAASAPAAPEPITSGTAADHGIDLEPSFSELSTIPIVGGERDASMLDVPIKPAGTVDEAPTTETPAKPDAPAAESEPVADAAPATPEKPTDDPAAAVPVALPEEAAKVLIDTAKALGLTETDPAKIPAAIEAYKASLETQANEARAEADRKAEQELVASFATEARAATDALMEEPVRAATLAAMRRDIPMVEAIDEEGNTVLKSPLDIPEWWKPETWQNPAYGPALEAQYRQVYQQHHTVLSNEPTWRTVYENDLASRQSAYEGEKAKIAEIGDNYKFHNAQLLADIRRTGAKPEVLEHIAKLTHTDVERHISTVNSENVSLKAQLEAAQAEIAGHAAAIDAARTEGRNAVIKELGQPNPATAGLESSAITPSNDTSLEPDFGWLAGAFN